MAFYNNVPFVHHLRNCHCLFIVSKISKQKRHWHHVHWKQHTSTSKCYSCLRFLHWGNRTWTTTKSEWQLTDDYKWKHLFNCCRKRGFKCLWLELFCNMIRLLANDLNIKKNNHTLWICHSLKWSNIRGFLWRADQNDMSNETRNITILILWILNTQDHFVLWASYIAEYKFQFKSLHWEQPNKWVWVCLFLY